MGSTAVEWVSVGLLQAKIISDGPINWVAPLVFISLIALDFLVFGRVTDKPFGRDRDLGSLIFRCAFLTFISVVVVGCIVHEHPSLKELWTLVLLGPGLFMTARLGPAMTRYCDACGSEVRQAFGSRSEYTCPMCGTINSGRR